MEYTITFIPSESGWTSSTWYTWNWNAKTMLSNTRGFKNWYRKLYGITWKIERRAKK